MKKLLALMIALLLILTALPVLSMPSRSTVARTTLLDLSNATTSSSSTSEGWAFNPTGNNGSPLLTLNSYGRANAHGAPILVPANSKVIVNGDCYIDNVYMGEQFDVLSSCCDGYLIVEGNGTLNLYAESYKGRCICVPNGGENVNNEFLYINNVTVNCYGMERTMYDTHTYPACIYGHNGVEIHNAVINTNFGRYGIYSYGFTPIGGTSEETANLILIDSSTVNIQNYSDNGLWNYAEGIHTTFGKVKITGSSNVTINAGSSSIYSYHSLTIDGGSVNIVSMPVSTADSAALVYCSKLNVGQNITRIYFTTVRYPLTKVLYCKNPGESTFASGLNIEIGAFSSGDFTTAPDPNNNNLPALLITNSSSPTEYHTVRFYGYGGVLLSQMSVVHGQAAQAPTPESVVNNSNGTFVFGGWDQDFSFVTSDLDVHAEYVLLGDTDLNGTVTSADALLALRYVMGVVDLSVKQKAAADVTFNGTVESADALKILRYVMGVIATLA
ncbi:MAG: dockerin type I repeat-containing protein [Clostridia bacterium]|nr:dockerin type I repeat-containing protein [Clostridia bacterium]